MVTVLPGLDPQALTAWLDLVAPGLRAGPLVVSLMVGGESNLTYRVHDGVHDWVCAAPRWPTSCRARTTWAGSSAS